MSEPRQSASGQRIDELLRQLAEPPPPPPPGDRLERELAELRPVSPRAPGRQLAIALAVSLAAGAGLLGLLGVRRDLELLPPVWLVLYCTGWLIGFAGLGGLALLPRRGQVSPAWRIARAGALVAGGLFVGAGLLLAREVPGASTTVGGESNDLWRYGHGCLRAGLVTALAPLLLGVLFLRRAVPVGAVWVGAALGAGGGALGGLMLHLHCPITPPLHLGLIHGGVVVIGGLLGALLAPRVLRP